MPLETAEAILRMRAQLAESAARMLARQVAELKEELSQARSQIDELRGGAHAC